MRAFGVSGYGPIETVHELALPMPEPGPGEVRVRVAASAVNPADYKVIEGTAKFLHARRMPIVSGYDFSGTVDAVGPNVSGLAQSSEVFGFLPYSPGNRRGAFAEFLIAKAGEVAVKPPSVSHVQAAAAATPGLTAIQAMRNLGKLRSGGRVLITGVSGGVGSIAVAIAGRMGAEVTAVGTGRGLDLAARAGARHVLDRSKVSVTSVLPHSFDVVFDAAAAYRWRALRGCLRSGGAYVTTLPSVGFLVDKVTSLFSATRAHVVMVRSRPGDLAALAGWLEKGLEVAIDSTVPLGDVRRGLARLKDGRPIGRVAVTVA